MNIIGNKMFAYIDSHDDLTVSMINQYNDSLIFIGDEKQIFVPLINAYVGIGTTAYEGLLAKIGESNSNLNEYNKYIHNDTVTSIYAQFNPDELEEYRQNSGGHATVRGISITEKEQTDVVFKANKNVVLKGLNDYNLPNGLDELGRVVATQNTSGITLNITHNSNIRTGKYSFNGIEYSYTYYDPYDTITIDDTKTWSYIMASNSYMINFVTKFATQQADRVYKNLLGENTVYIEKEFDEAFNYDSVTGTLNVFENVFVKLADGSFKMVDIQNYDDGFAVSVNGIIIYSTSATHPIAPTTNLENILAGEHNAGLYGGYFDLGTGTSNSIIPVWYHRDNSATASSYYNIADGIQTLKEIAYVLDTITDGNGSGYDTGIQLAYNIANNHDAIVDLQNWKQQLGNETVSSFKSESGTELLTVNYYSTNLWDKDRDSDDASIGKVKLDIDLKLAQTYVLDGVSYVAYLIDHPGVTNTTYFIYKGDPTDVNNYLQLNNANGSATSGSGYANKSEEIKALLKKKFTNYTDSTTVPYYEFIIDPNNNSRVIGREQKGAVSLANLTASAVNGKYIYFPYEEAEYEFNKGLTDVKWVTTYVGWTVYDLNNKIDTINTNLAQEIQDVIDSLNKDDQDETTNGLFVSYVTQTNGVINVNKKKLPLDTILKNDVFYTSDIYLHITTAEAKTIEQNNPGHIYVLNNGIYSQIGINQLNNFTADLYDYVYYKTTLYDMQAVPGSTSANPATVGDMILNGGNVTYFYKQSSNGYTKYIPLDIQTAYTEGTLFTNDVVTDEDTIYYLNIGNSISQIKYFDVSTVHRTNGSTTTLFTSYITYLSAASSTNSGLADAWDVRRTIESMFKWVDLKTNKIIE